MKTSIGLSLDWLSFTFKPTNESYKQYLKKKIFTERFPGLTENEEVVPDDIHYFFAAFPEFDAIKSDFLVLSGVSHYENVVGFLGVSDTCRISFNSAEYTNKTEMGVNVCIPSHGLEWFWDLMGIDKESDNAVQQMFMLLKDRGCQASRIDLAFDDFSKKYRPKDYASWWWSDMIRTRYQKIQTVNSSNRRDVGYTLYMGSRNTGKMLRIYDKDVQSNGAIDAVRYEFELHVKYARDMFEYLIENKTIDFVAYLRSYFEVIERKNNKSNKSMCPLLPEWEEWLLNLRFANSLPEKAVIPRYTLPERKADATYWLLHSCMRNIKGFVQCFGFEALKEAIYKDRREIPDKYRVLYEFMLRDQFAPAYNDDNCIHESLWG